MHDLEVSACHKPEAKTTQMREVELALVVCEAAGQPTQDHESRQACFASQVQAKKFRLQQRTPKKFANAQGEDTEKSLDWIKAELRSLPQTGSKESAVTVTKKSN